MSSARISKKVTFFCTMKTNMDVTRDIERFYQEFNPEKLDDPTFVSRVAKTYRGRYDHLFRVLRAKYVFRQDVASRRIAKWFRRQRQRRDTEILTFYLKYNPEKLEDPTHIRRSSDRYGLVYRDLLWERLREKYVEDPHRAATRLQRWWRSILLVRDLHSRISFSIV
jgi:hypothetical protein